jgi:hypothetical protein
LFKHAEWVPEGKVLGGERSAADHERSEKKRKRFNQSH